MARLAVLVVALMVVAVAVAQNSYTLDIFDVAMDGVSTRTAGPVSAYVCTPSSASTTGLAGGVRKVQVSTPAGGSGNIVGSTISMTVFIPGGSTTAPSGVSSGNNNVQNSPTYVALYRLDGQTSLCSSGQNTQATTAMTRSTNNLNINLQTIGANAFAFRALGDVTTTTVTVTLYSPSGTALATSTPVSVANSGQSPTFTLYTLNFSDNTKWQTGSSFTGTVGAIELTWNLPQNLQFAVNLVQFLVTATTNVGATVFIDCGCNGFQQGSGDSLQANVVVTLTFGGGCTNAQQTQTTSSTGTVSFTGIPGGCTYTLSITNSGLCASSSASQTVAAGGSVNFALQGTTGSFSAPPTATINCGGDTSATATGAGTPNSGVGQCGGSGSGAFTFTDVVNQVKCTAPGGIVTTITRTFTQTGTSAQVTQTINIVDTKAITLVGVPTSTTLACNVPVPTVTVTGVACTAVTVVPTQTTQAGTCNTATCSTTGGTTTVTYTGTDVCGNTVSRQTVYTQSGCNVACPPPPPPSVPPPPTAVPPPPTQLPTNANCRFICDDDDSSAVQVMFSVVMLLVAAVAAF